MADNKQRDLKRHLKANGELKSTAPKWAREQHAEAQAVKADAGKYAKGADQIPDNKSYKNPTTRGVLRGGTSNTQMTVKGRAYSEPEYKNVSGEKTNVRSEGLNKGNSRPNFTTNSVGAAKAVEGEYIPAKKTGTSVVPSGFAEKIADGEKERKGQGAKVINESTRDDSNAKYKAEAEEKTRRARVEADAKNMGPSRQGFDAKNAKVDAATMGPSRKSFDANNAKVDAATMGPSKNAFDAAKMGPSREGFDQKAGTVGGKFDAFINKNVHAPAVTKVVEGAKNAVKSLASGNKVGATLSGIGALATVGNELSKVQAVADDVNTSKMDVLGQALRGVGRGGATVLGNVLGSRAGLAGGAIGSGLGYALGNIGNDNEAYEVLQRNKEADASVAANEMQTKQAIAAKVEAAKLKAAEEAAKQTQQAAPAQHPMMAIFEQALANMQPPQRRELSSANAQRSNYLGIGSFHDALDNIPTIMANNADVRDHKLRTANGLAIAQLAGQVYGHGQTAANAQATTQYNMLKDASEAAGKYAPNYYVDADGKQQANHIANSNAQGIIAQGMQDPRRQAEYLNPLTRPQAFNEDRVRGLIAANAGIADPTRLAGTQALQFANTPNQGRSAGLSDWTWSGNGVTLGDVMASRSVYDVQGSTGVRPLSSAALAGRDNPDAAVNTYLGSMFPKRN